MDTNAPIGVPSGWEECAAWAYAALYKAGESLSKDYISRAEYTFPASNFSDQELPHDWRVEE